MKRSILAASAVTLALLLPIVATAAVVVNSGIAVNYSPSMTNQVYFVEGTGYTVANQSGYMGIYGNNAKYTNLSMDLSSVPGSGYVVLTNVLEIYNATSTTGTVNVWLNGTLPIGVAMYESSSPITFNGTTVSGTQVLGNGMTSTEIHISSAGNAGYIAFKLSGEAAGNAVFTLQYTIS